MAIKYLNALAINGNGGTVLDVQGSQGQLFSVTDSLTGDIFAVSDISGVPILKVNSSGAVNIDGTLTSSGNITGLRLRAGDGTDGYFYSDSAGRTAFRDGDFYIQSNVSNAYNYATNNYHGGSSGDNQLFRGNPLSGDNWSITAAGAITAITFSGDLNGTINTATVGTTQTAGTGGTLIATCGYADAAAAAVDPSGVYLPLAGGTMTGAINAAGGLYFVGDSNMGFVPYPIGAQFRSDSSALTGYIKIELPTDIGSNPDDMVSFYVDVYDYTTNEMISLFIGGYTYTSGGAASSYWYNCTAIINTKQTAKDFDVKFGFDGTHFYVAIGETTSVWSHPSIVVRDVQCSYRSNVVHYIDGWDVSVTTTALVGVDETQTGNLPKASGAPYSGLSGTVPTWNQDTTGNAATATSSVTQSAGNNSTLIATTAYADAAAGAVPIGNYLPLAGGTMDADSLIGGSGTLELGGAGVTNLLFDSDGTNIMRIVKASATLKFAEIISDADEVRLRIRDGMDIYYDDTAITNYMKFEAIGVNKTEFTTSAFEVVGIGSSSGETLFTAEGGGAVTLYHADVLQLETTTTGISTNTIDATVAAGSAGNFVVMDGTRLSYRTAAEVLSDIGGAPATGGSYLPLAGGVMTGKIGRSTAITGFLEGSYNNVGDNATNSNPIYTIGSNYNPASTTLSNMYGIGYCHYSASFMTLSGASGWGMYVASDGDARVWLDGGNGNISTTGDLYLGGSEIIGDGKTIIRFNDSWLRINADNEFVSGIYCSTGILRTDGTLQVGNVGDKFQVDSDGNIRIRNKAQINQQENTNIDASTSPELVAQVSITDYTAAFFDFVVKKGTNVRSGTVYACHDGTNVEFTETSTNDLGDTSDVTLSVDKTSTNMRLLATVTSDDWSVKSLIRAI